MTNITNMIYCFSYDPIFTGVVEECSKCNAIVDFEHIQSSNPQFNEQRHVHCNVCGEFVKTVSVLRVFAHVLDEFEDEDIEDAEVIEHKPDSSKKSGKKKIAFAEPSKK